MISCEGISNADRIARSRQGQVVVLSWEEGEKGGERAKTDIDILNNVHMKPSVGGL